MKTFIFVRGYESKTKEETVKKLLSSLNPSINSISAFVIGINSQLSKSNGDKKAADRSVKNLVKKILMSYDEKNIIIDNNSIQPIHWQSYIKLSSDTNVETRSFGIDVFDKQTEDKKIKLQNEYLDTFKLEMTKYYKIQNINDIESTLEILLSDLEV